MTGSLSRSALRVVLAACAVCSAHAAEVELVPVGATGPHKIVGNEIILPGGGKEVTFEIRASGWDPFELRLWQTGIAFSSFTGSEAGTALPLGWDRPFEPVPCLDDEGCPPGFTCWDPPICVGPDHDPELGFFIDSSRSDYIFFGLPELSAVDYLDYRVGSTVFQPGAYPVYEPPSKYCATLILVLSEDAAGTFSVQLASEHTLLQDPTFTIIPVTLSNAQITIAESVCGNGVCEPGEDYRVCPADCPPTRLRSIQGDEMSTGRVNGRVTREAIEPKDSGRDREDAD